MIEKHYYIPHAHFGVNTLKRLLNYLAPCFKFLKREGASLSLHAHFGVPPPLSLSDPYIMPLIDSLLFCPLVDPSG